MADPSLSATERLVQHLARPVDADTRARARLHLLDWLGCVAGAGRSDVAAVARAAEPDPAMRAALLGNVLEMDDVHRAALLHPGPVVWPALFAAARAAPAAMDALLDAAVRGYEAMIALGGTFDTFHYARWHNTSTAGGFGATAATGSLFGLAPDQMVSALGHAASVAGGLWHMRHAPGAMTKQFHVRHAVETGLRAAQLAHHGLVGSPAILEGPQGLYAAMTKVPEPMAVPERWRIEEVSFKPWAACRHAHPAIDAALLLRGESALTLPVTVETYADAVTFCDRPEPKTVTEAKFSIQHAVAVVALRGEPQPADFEPDAIGDPELARCRASVEVREAADISARYPEHFGARLTAAGRTVELVDTRGDPERPLSPQGVVRKARQLFDWGGLDRHQAGRAVMLASEGSDAAAIVRLLEDGL